MLASAHSLLPDPQLLYEAVVEDVVDGTCRSDMMLPIKATTGQ